MRIMNFLGPLVNQGGITSSNEILNDCNRDVFPWPWRSEGVIYVATTIANHRPTMKIRFYKTNQMTRFIYHKFTLTTQRINEFQEVYAMNSYLDLATTLAG